MQAVTRTSLTPPKIIAVMVEGTERSGFSTVCRVLGSPLPDVQWFGLYDLLEGSVLGPPAQGAQPHSYHTLSQLRDVEPGQQYTCSASNPLGREQATLYVASPPLCFSFPCLWGQRSSCLWCAWWK
ncbi:V-set and Ig domain-containing protein [Xyrichtys novacula]|uniref:V-set and Ig domain-containing protein n=1 Tax=Xyrichtys novacula TaxID=13765 RepID=A0AAV1FIK0_XYRNO|nr:V-set and Ig domain-containing protein [Xyrichtys novacula]